VVRPKYDRRNIVLPVKTGLFIWAQSRFLTGDNLGRKPRADRSPDEKWQRVQEGGKSGNVSGDALALRHCSHTVVVLEG
jgi:hypothetical protein